MGNEWIFYHYFILLCSNMVMNLYFIIYYFMVLIWQILYPVGFGPCMDWWKANKEWMNEKWLHGNRSQQYPLLFMLLPAGNYLAPNRWLQMSSLSRLLSHDWLYLRDRITLWLAVYCLSTLAPSPLRLTTGVFCFSWILAVIILM
jgi:hypothetical protein